MRLVDFEFYRDLLYKKSGLALAQDKVYLLESRLTPVAKKWEYPSLDSMTVALRGIPEDAMVRDVVEAMTTNETSFFRDNKPFELFRDFILPAIAKKREKVRALRIWCAASSSGQEPYSLAMTILENQRLVPGWKIEIVATDISNDILEKARKAEYSQFEVQRGLPVQLLVKYFQQKEDGWSLKDDVRKMVKFQNFNLLNNMAALGTFDIVFCRNVLIYFDEKTKADVLARMAQRLPPDGFLVLGGAETVLGISDAFKPLENRRGIYVLSGNTEAQSKAASS